MLSEGYLERDGDLGFVGPEAERKFGRRHFSGLTASFIGPPDFTVVEGRTEIGTLPLSALTAAVEGPRVVLLAGRSWEVGFIDWKRRRCFVTSAMTPGRAARWSGLPLDLSFTVVRAMRDVILGDAPADVTLTRRAVAELTEVRGLWADTVHLDGTVLARGHGDLTWWTWAGGAANRTLLASLHGVADPHQRTQPFALRLRPDLSNVEMTHLLSNAVDEPLTEPAVDEEAVRGLKFSEALAPGLAAATLAERLGDPTGALAALREPRRFVHHSVT
jgi:ATP-dependent Lhr-like helicase